MREQSAVAAEAGIIGGAWSIRPATVPDDVDVEAIRFEERPILTQEAFGKLYGFTHSAVRN